MPRRKVTMRFIENARARAATYAKRSKGLQKKASELSVLCGVPVALVCSPGAGAGSRLVWESEEGVIERYRAAAVPPAAGARHTHRSYLEAELGKERAKLARARPGALPDWDAALNDMTPDEAKEVLGAIDAALSAAGDRMVSLGLPAEGPLELQQVAAPDDASDDVALDRGMDYAGFQTQMMPCHGGTNDQGGLFEEFLMQPDYSLEYGGGRRYDVGAIDETQASSGYCDNAGCSWPDLTMWCPADESWNAVMPVGHYPEFSDGAPAPEHYSVTCEDYDDTLPLDYPMGMDENFAYPDMDNSYAAHWQAEEFQRSNTSTSTGTGTGQYQWSDPGTHSSGQGFHYLY